MEDRVTLSKLTSEGFVFKDFGQLPEKIFQAIENLPYEPACLPEGVQSTYKCGVDKDSPIYQYFISKYLEAVKGDKFLESLAPYMKVGIDKCVQGDWIMPHTDIAMTGVAQAACFYTRDENFKGREFYFGSDYEFGQHRPDNRTAVFIETTQEKFVHACGLLESDSVFYAVGIYPVVPGGRNELLIPRDDLTNKWGVCGKKS